MTSLETPETLQDTTRLTRAAGTVWRRSMDGVVILPPGQGHPICVDATGGLMWDLLDHGTTFAAMVSELATRYQVGEAVVHPGVAEVLAALARAGALETVSS